MGVLPHSEYSHRKNKKNAVRTSGVAKQTKWSAQVTIYPDVIDSAGAKRELFKDAVRKLAE
jgi:GMP synthase PP-ATPase subunit